MSEQQHDHPDVITLPPLIYVAGLLVGIALKWVIPLSMWEGWPRLAVGIPLMALGFLGASWAVVLMQAAGTSADPHAPTTKVITRGPFAFTRNPIYLSFVLFYAGVAIAANAPVALMLLLVVIVVVDRGVIAREEVYLERKFGDAYREYKSRVRRWI